MFITVPTLSHKNPIHALPSYLFQINFNISLPSMLGLRDFWIFQRRCWRLTSSNIWRRISGRVLLDVLKGHRAFIFRVKQSFKRPLS